MADIDTRIKAAQAVRTSATKYLLELVRDTCPGPHEPIQHRDARPAWCPVCERTALGDNKDEIVRVQRSRSRVEGAAADGVASFIASRARCATCGHRRKDHEEEPYSSCNRYDDPYCGCVKFIEEEDNE